MIELKGIYNLDLVSLGDFSQDTEERFKALLEKHKMAYLVG